MTGLGFIMKMPIKYQYISQSLTHYLVTHVILGHNQFHNISILCGGREAILQITDSLHAAQD